MSKNSIRESVCITIPAGKEKEFWKVILNAGFDESGSGVYEYIMAEEEENSSGILNSAMKNWTENNPEQWETVKKKGSRAIGNLLFKIVKKL